MTTEQLRERLDGLCERMPQSVLRSGLGKEWVAQRRAALKLLNPANRDEPRAAVRNLCHGALSVTLLDRIMSRCIEEGECLIWQGACTCRIYVKDDETGAWVHKPVRRALWEIRHGQPKPGHLIFPNCATPMCVGCIMSGTKKMHSARRKQLGLSAMRPDAIAKIAATKRARYGIPNAKILQAKQMLDAGALQVTIARELGLSKASISRIHLGQRYASVPGSSVFHQR